MKKTKYGLVTSEEAKICGDLERWLKDKKRRSVERRFSYAKEVRQTAMTMKMDERKRQYGERIKKVHDQYHCTMKEFANALGTSSQMMSQMERGNSHVSFHWYWKVLNILDSEEDLKLMPKGLFDYVKPNWPDWSKQ